MSDYDLELLEHYHSSGIVVDANLLLLHIVGSADVDQIARFKRTRIFTDDDFLALQLILKRFEHIIVTPNLLTEVNSFLNQLPMEQRAYYFAAFALQIVSLEEVFLSSATLSEKPEFVAFGLTDTGLSSLAGRDYLVLTTDGRLADYLQRQGWAAINFNHFRRYI